MARERKRKLEFDTKKLVERALRFFNDDTSSRSIEMDIRAQRYAKYRQWKVENADRPWDSAADTVVADMTRASLKTQDVLYNAVIGTRPILLAKATHEKDKPKQDAIDQTLDYQAFVENGETWVSDLVEHFVNDGHFTAFIPWVDEKRVISTTKIFPALPNEATPTEYFMALLQQEYRGATILPKANSDPDSVWDFLVMTPEVKDSVSIAFHTADNGTEIEMVMTKEITRFQGPKILIKDMEDVLAPPRAVNLQPPGPSNPNGASHVILVDYPTIDEIRRLHESGFYDGMSAAEVQKLGRKEANESEQKMQTERDTFQGVNAQNLDVPPEHKTVTRMMVFDLHAMSDTKTTEDLVYWVLKEDEIVLRVRRMSEVYPDRLGSRPFAEEQFIPLAGRRTGLGILEMTEGIHDITKQLQDQSLDHGAMSLVPFGFYRPSSSMKPEIMELEPGIMYPLNDPKNDVNFPTFSQGGQAYALNMLGHFGQEHERLTMIGDLQQGRVPKGKASALRTASGISQIAGQGESRPERVLRRMFLGLGQIWTRMHEVNMHFMDAEKQFRIAKVFEHADQPYRTVTKDDLDGIVTFEFQANAFNTSKQMLQESLGNVGAIILNPLPIQLGLVGGQQIANFLTDYVKAWGQDAERYVIQPTGLPPITFEEAIVQILATEMPRGVPMEPTQIHLEKLQLFQNSPEFEFLTPEQNELFEQWVEQVLGVLKLELEREQLGAAAGGQEPQQESGGQSPPQEGPAPVEENELTDKSLPTGGSGADG